jgi:hypothetical protein
MYEPCQYERSCRSQASTSQTDGCDFERLRGIGSIGGKVRDGSRAKTPLLAQKLRSDNEIPEMFEESLVVRPAEPRIHGFLQAFCQY